LELTESLTIYHGGKKFMTYLQVFPLVQNNEGAASRLELFLRPFFPFVELRFGLEIAFMAIAGCTAVCL